MYEPLTLHVKSMAHTLLEVENVGLVQVQLADGGGIGILPGHAPLIAETITAPVRYVDSSGEHTMEVDAGLLLLKGNNVTILAEEFTSCDDASEHIDNLWIELLGQMLRSASTIEEGFLQDADTQ